jgi:hypothetical protein
MRNRLTEASAREIKHYVERAFADANTFEIPVIGGPFFVCGRGLQIDELKRQAIAALSARERFRFDAPRWWTQPLPLREGECAYLQQSPDNREKIVGFYGASLRHRLWDYDRHPLFTVFARGAVHSPFFPASLEEIRQLADEFPPARLPGLDGDMIWRWHPTPG